CARAPPAMTELPEVQTVLATLAPRVLERRIGNVPHVRDDMVTPAGVDLAAALAGRSIADLTRRGKRIIFHLDDGHAFFIHLGMTGRLSVVPQDAPIQPHTHLRLDLGEGKELRFRDARRFGEIRWLGPTLGDEKMGPEPL